MAFFDNPFDLGLEESPEATFFSAPQRDQFETSPVRSRYFENQFSTVFNDYLRKQGESLRAGEIPTQTFRDTVDSIDFDTKFRSLPPNLRGFFQRQVAPQTRTLVGF